MRQLVGNIPLASQGGALKLWRSSHATTYKWSLTTSPTPFSTDELKKLRDLISKAIVLEQGALTENKPNKKHQGPQGRQHRVCQMCENSPTGCSAHPDDWISARIVLSNKSSLQVTMLQLSPSAKKELNAGVPNLGKIRS